MDRASWRIRTLAGVALVLLAAACGKEEPPPAAQAPPPGAPPFNMEMKQLAQDVYIYAYPLVLMDVSKEVMTAQAPVNRLHHLRTFPDPTFTDVVSPNADTLYSQSWMDLSQEPMVLSVPAMGKRYYLMPMLDAWTDVFASPGTRTTGNGKGNYAIVGPNWKGELPKGVAEIKSPTEMVWLIGRTQTNGKADYPAVHKIQDQYRLTPLSRFGKPAPKTEPLAPSADAAPSARVDTKTSPVEQVASMSAEAFFTRLAKLLPGNPPLPDDGPMVEKMNQLGVVPGQPFEMIKLDTATTKSVEEVAKAGLASIKDPSAQSAGLTNGWSISKGYGAYGTNYAERAYVAYVGLGANLSEDALYPMTRVDSDGHALRGSNKYTLRFEKGLTPPASAFWSLTVYNDRQAFVENSISRYAIGDRDKLKLDPDGSLTLLIQHESPGADKEANWLPAPADSFNLIMRIYWPKKEVIDGAWLPPAVQRVD